MTRGATYSETLDQPALSQLFDLDQAETSPSFRRFRRLSHDIFRRLTR